jgi:hypothetical protein
MWPRCGPPGPVPAGLRLDQNACLLSTELVVRFFLFSGRSGELLKRAQHHLGGAAQALLLPSRTGS